MFAQPQGRHSPAPARNGCTRPAVHCNNPWIKCPRIWRHTHKHEISTFRNFSRGISHQAAPARWSDNPCQKQRADHTKSQSPTEWWHSTNMAGEPHLLMCGINPNTCSWFPWPAGEPELSVICLKPLQSAKFVIALLKLLSKHDSARHSLHPCQCKSSSAPPGLKGWRGERKKPTHNTTQTEPSPAEVFVHLLGLHRTGAKQTQSLSYQQIAQFMVNFK